MKEERSCSNCYYKGFSELAHPCAVCIRGIERTDMWQPAKADDIDLELIDYCMVREQEGDWICNSCQRKEGCKWRW